MNLSMKMGGGNSPPNPLQCSLPLTSTDQQGKPILAKGAGPVTFGRASKQLVTDFEGQLRTVQDGCAAIEGSRVVTNLLSISSGLELFYGAGGGTKPDNNTFISTTGVQSRVETSSMFVGQNQTVVFSVELAGDPGDTVRLQIVDPGTWISSQTPSIALTGEYRKYSVTRVTPVSMQSSGFVRLYIISTDGIAGTVKVKKVQLENVTGQSNQAPGEYVPTTGAPVTQCFDYLNPFTVDANGVVTDSVVRTPITGIKGILLEPFVSNKCSNWNVIPEDTLGSEVNTGGTFTGWLINAEPGSNITTGTLNLIATGTIHTAAYKAALGVIGRFSNITYTISAISSGSIAFRFNSCASVSTRTAPGTYTDLLFCGAGSGSLELVAGTGTNASLTLMSVKELQFAVGTIANSLNPTAVPGLTLSGFVQTTGALVVGAKYKINTRTTLDFTLHGAASNNANTVFTATSAGVLGASDSVDNQSVTLSIVDDSDAHKTAGIYAQTGGKAYYLNGTLGAVRIHAYASGAANNTNVHALQVTARGTGATLYNSATGAGLTAVSSSPIYTKTTKEAYTTSAGSTCGVACTAGGQAFFILNQLEELPYCTSPIIVQGTQAARAATVLSIPTLGNIKANDMTLYLEHTPKASGTTRILQSTVDGASYTILGSRTATQNSIYGISASVEVANASRANTLVIGTTNKCAFKLSSTLGKSTFVDGLQSPVFNNLAAIALGDSLGTNTGFLIPCALKNLRIYRKPLSDAALIALTTP